MFFCQFIGGVAAAAFVIVKVSLGAVIIDIIFTIIIIFVIIFVIFLTCSDIKTEIIHAISTSTLQRLRYGIYKLLTFQFSYNRNKKELRMSSTAFCQPEVTTVTCRQTDLQ